ncbi:MAG TPA: hypothetical protein VGP22_16795 [Albitalea sp.]|nr:hypothetical protein [Albitalea sp.]
MPTTMRAVPRASSKPLALLVSLMACAAAQAEDRPWHIGVSQAFTHETNVFRKSGGEVSDNISSTGVLGGLDWRPGRQHLYFNGTAARNRYSKLDQLNNDSNSANAGLDWETVESLSGNLRYTRRQELSDYTVVATPDVKNIVKIQQASGAVRFGFAAHLGVEGTLDRRKIDYSISNERDTTEDVASLGVKWSGTSVLTLGVAGRVTKGETPLYQPLLPLDLTNQIPVLGGVEPDKMDRKDIDFTATWVPSGLSTLTGRISLTKVDHTAPSRADFNGVTGAVTWEYVPTGKTKIRSSLIRDTGNETSFLALTQLGLSSLRFDNNRLNWIAVLEGDWEATAKILVNGSLRYINGTLDTITGSSFNGNTIRLGLGARYLATRNITLGCNLVHDQGGSTFSASIYGCSASFVLQ